MGPQDRDSHTLHPRHPLELLSPARDLNCGLAAIGHGADSVYIGGPAFGARAAAGNSLVDIEKLVRAAHPFGVRVYVALNTLLEDGELEQAVGQINRYYDMGVDGLIIQDLGLLELELPPIPLHASTQMNNRSPEKVRFLEAAGFSQVVLARELGLQQIREIRAVTSIPLEFFVHGALCVSYSGQCYMSEKVAGRSANRGECAQFCRHRYRLTDRDGNRLLEDGYLLSLKDLDLSDQLESLVDAGVSSFKIEGRLKGEDYVKNLTWYYRRKLDKLLSRRPELARYSVGRSEPAFSPDPGKTFQRGATSYFLERRRAKPAELRTPKATGEYLGRVKAVERSGFLLETRQSVNNGDGLCFFSQDRSLVGFRVNRVEKEGRLYRLFPANRVKLEVGTILYRNIDKVFRDRIRKSSGERRIDVELVLEEVNGGLQLTCRDETGLITRTCHDVSPQPATTPGTAAAVAGRQLAKSGPTVFRVISVKVTIDPAHFYPAAVFNELRRRGLSRHLEERIDRHVIEPEKSIPGKAAWPATEPSDLWNITNSAARRFYERHGVNPKDLTPSSNERQEFPLMTCRYCIRHQLDLCPKQTEGLVTGSGGGAEPLIITDNTGSYRLVFDCRKCEMQIWSRGGGVNREE